MILYSLTQLELALFLKAKYPFLQECEGNLYHLSDTSKPVFVAHMDTVMDRDMKKPLVHEDGFMSRKNGILGADDRAGIDIICRLLPHCNCVFTRDEESGLQGSGALSENDTFMTELEKFPFLVQLDRKGSSDIVGEFNGYCGAELSEYVSAISEYEYTPAIGVLTDLDALCGGYYDIEGVNLSVGYYNQHSKSEYLCWDDWAKALKLAVKLNG